MCQICRKKPLCQCHPSPAGHHSLRSAAVPGQRFGWVGYIECVFCSARTSLSFLLRERFIHATPSRPFTSADCDVNDHAQLERLLKYRRQCCRRVTTFLSLPSGLLPGGVPKSALKHPISSTSTRPRWQSFTNRYGSKRHLLSTTFLDRPMDRSCHVSQHGLLIFLSRHQPGGVPKAGRSKLSPVARSLLGMAAWRNGMLSIGAAGDRGVGLSR
jgi:hypothetical protein